MPKGLPGLQGSDQLGHLIGGGQDRSKEATVLQRFDNLGQIGPGTAHIQKEGIYVALVKPLGNVTQLELDAVRQPQRFQVLLSQAQDVGTELVGIDLAIWPHRAGQRKGQAPTAGPCLDDPASRHDVELEQGIANVLGIHDLRGALELLDQVKGARLQDDKGIAQVRVNLPPQGLAQQILVIDTAPVRLELSPCPEPHDELFPVLADEQDQIVFLSDIHGHSPISSREQIVRGVPSSAPTWALTRVRQPQDRWMAEPAVHRL